MSFCNGILSGAELANVKKIRNQRYIFKTFPKALCSEMLEQGWELNKELKRSVSMKRLKPIDEQFEDEVWTIFANLGFTEMNKDRNFKIQYDIMDSNGSKQIDVFAADGETVLLIECKTADSLKKGNFKDEIESWRGIKGDLIKAIKMKYPTQKIKFIFATKNCYPSNPDKERLKAIDFLHFDENDIRYYRDLSKHLGHSARYQLLGNLFAGQRIPGMDNTVLAIRGKMGGKVYYSFSIEPEKLLKIGYVLHRNSVNDDPNLMPTYQRLVKKDRLNAIRAFINKGGYFPNSIILNIDNSRNDLKFDFADKRIETSETRIGILHLPQVYRSAYIIDGQHRLYGYADTKYASKDSIPVIAFEDLPEKEQLQLFIDINENQKAVPKNLRLTLEDDLYWDSKDRNLQRQALRSRIAQRLGEDKNSPLHNHVIIGEDTEKTDTCCIAMKFITDALYASNFFTKYGKSNSVTYGSFDRDNNTVTFSIFYPFLCGCLGIMQEALPAEWDRGSQDNGVLTINIGIYAFIKVLNDIVDHLVNQKVITPTIDKVDNMLEKVSPYLQPLIEYYKSITPKEREELKKKRGSGGPGDYWHILQQAINTKFPEFNPPGLADWIFANMHVYNDETFKMLHQISENVRTNIQERLSAYYGDSWFIKGLPKSVYDKTTKAANDYNYANSSLGLKKVPWDFISLADCKNIVTKSGNWAEIFEPYYADPRYGKSKAKKGDKAEWLNLASKLLSQNFETYSVSEEEYETVSTLYSWFVLKSPTTKVV